MSSTQTDFTPMVSSGRFLFNSIRVQFGIPKSRHDKQEHIVQMGTRWRNNEFVVVHPDPVLTRLCRDHAHFSLWMSVVHVIVLYGERYLGCYGYENKQVADLLTFPLKVMECLQTNMKPKDWQTITQKPQRPLRTMTICRRFVGSVAAFVHFMVYSPDPTKKYHIRQPPAGTTNMMWNQGHWRDFKTGKPMTPYIDWEESLPLRISLEGAQRTYSISID